MVRPARPDEKPRFGQVWSWADSEMPVMAVAPDSDRHDYWLFFWLAEPVVGIDLVSAWSWTARNGDTLGDWTLLDDD